MRVEQLMTRNVETCRPGDSLWAAAHIMWRRGCSCVPVVEREGLAGMVTDRDVCMAAYTRDRKLSDIEVRAAMTTAPFSCRPTDSVESALNTMEGNHLRRLPVVDQGGRLVGLLSLTDVAREGARSHARATKEMIDCRVGEVVEALTVPRDSREGVDATR